MPLWWGNGQDPLSEEKRRVVMPPEPKDTSCKKCPQCDHLSVVPLCWFLWQDTELQDDTPSDKAVAKRRKEPHHDACDISVCIVCFTRIHFERGVTWTPGPEDYTLERFQTMHEWDI